MLSTRSKLLVVLLSTILFGLIYNFLVFPAMWEETVVEKGEVIVCGGSGKFISEFEIVSGSKDISLSIVSTGFFLVEINGELCVSSLSHGEFSVPAEGEINKVDFQYAKDVVLVEIQEEVVIRTIDYRPLIMFIALWLMLLFFIFIA